MTSTDTTIYDSDVPNDSVDIYDEPQIKVKKIKSDVDEELIVELSGHSVDHSVVNAIRRTILTEIPIYGFHRSNINIENKKSRNMYNNDHIYQQIESLVIFDVPNLHDLENPEVYMSNEVMRNLFSNFIQQTYDEDLSSEKPVNHKKMFDIELTISIKNNTDDYMYVSTHHVKLTVNGKVSDSYMKQKAICILVLKPNEELYLQAKANLGIAKLNAAYEATTNAYHEEIKPTKYRIWYETLGQLDKTVIFQKACTILIKKLGNLHEFIKKNYPERESNERVQVELYGEDDTLGNLLATVLQKCSYVEKAGYMVPHRQENRVVISYELFKKSKKKPIQVLLDSITYLIALFNQIEI